jgi:predicted O-methyltransferase YrrM
VSSDDIHKKIDYWIECAGSGTGDSDGHLLTLFSLGISSRATTFLELGVRGGSTTLPLLSAAHKNGGHLYSVDIEPANMEIPNDLAPSWTFTQSDSLAYLRNWPQEDKIDFVYLDDWHAYDHVKHELELLDKLVGPSSIILVHDLMYGRTEPFYHSDLSLKEGQWAEGGPYRAIAELDTNFWEFSTLPWSNGLTILRKKYSSLYHNR